ncbi:MAG: choice-of-anchor L domain-containing protein [Limnohabitans sp.]|nr:choice-of-anchor L domain-containing protein [Limnohabitans sp.]
MKRKELKIASLISLLFFIKTNCQNIQVNDTYTAQQLIENVLINSNCAQVFNFSVTGGNFSTGEQSYGYFTNSNPAFPFTNGVLLCTGKANSAIGPNTSIISDDGNVFWGGDSDLNQALSVSNTINSTVLEFDFIPKSSKVSFDYIFASEEYHDNAQCIYSDGFAFLLKKVGSSTYQNLALIPDTNIPVKVTTVHPDVPGGCSAQNAVYFDRYNDATYPTNFNGQTVVMTAKANVEAGATYHIKLVIADEANYKYDSAIFLGGGSFNSDLNFGPDRLVSTNNPYCFGENITLDATQTGSSNTYKWFKNGIFTGITTPTFTITDNTNTNIVNYSVEVNINGSCISTGKIKIQFAASPVLTNQTYTQCDNDSDGITTFNLTKLDDSIKNYDLSLGVVSYYETIGGVQISNPRNYTSTAKTIYAKCSNSYGCTSYATIVLKIANNTHPSPIFFTKCDDDNLKDGKTQINLSSEITPLISTTFPIEYYASAQEAITQENFLPNIYFNTSANHQKIFARIIDGKDCVSIVEINLKIIAFTPSNFEDETLYICKDNNLTLNVSAGFSNYNWSNSPSNHTNQNTINTPGIYTVEVTNAEGCKATKKFSVFLSAPATNINAQIIDFSDNNSIQILYTDNGGDYVFSIDGINYQRDSIFQNLSPGEYTIYVKDLRGCLPIVSKKVFVLDFPKFFTPNGDGYNDMWQIKNLNHYPESTISIFDRYGKLLKQFSSYSNGWNGTYNNENLPADDYWFVLTLSNQTIIKNHFSLKR